jgi:hypothetical protein
VVLGSAGAAVALAAVVGFVVVHRVRKARALSKQRDRALQSVKAHNPLAGRGTGSVLPLFDSGIMVQHEQLTADAIIVT